MQRGLKITALKIVVQRLEGITVAHSTGRPWNALKIPPLFVKGIREDGLDRKSNKFKPGKDSDFI